MTLNELSDDDLLARLEGLCIDSRRIDVRVIELLIEVEERRLDLRSACSSLYDFCVRRLRLSEGAAHRRMTVARMGKRFPCLLGHLESGKIHLSTLVVLRDYLTEDNVDELVEAASAKSRRDLEALLAGGAFGPNVSGKLTTQPAPAPATLALPTLLPDAPIASPPPTHLEPIAAPRYALHVMLGAEADAKLARARDLLRHANPSGAAEVIIERALDALIEKLEKRRLGKTSRPQRARQPAKPGTVASAVRREIFDRDAEQCAFVDDQDRRCPARGFLEIDHRKARALGGSDEAANLRLLCRAHNRLHAEEDFGREHVERQINLRQRRSVARAPTRVDASFETAKRGLVNMGFRATETTRALRQVAERHPEGFPLPEIIRAALRVLTDPP